MKFGGRTSPVTRTAATVPRVPPGATVPCIVAYRSYRPRTVAVRVPHPGTARHVPGYPGTATPGTATPGTAAPGIAPGYRPYWRRRPPVSSHTARRTTPYRRTGTAAPGTGPAHPVPPHPVYRPRTVSVRRTTPGYRPYHAPYRPVPPHPVPAPHTRYRRTRRRRGPRRWSHAVPRWRAPHGMVACPVPTGYRWLSPPSPSRDVDRFASTSTLITLDPSTVSR